MWCVSKGNQPRNLASFTHALGRATPPIFSSASSNPTTTTTLPHPTSQLKCVTRLHLHIAFAAFTWKKNKKKHSHRRIARRPFSQLAARACADSSAASPSMAAVCIRACVHASGEGREGACGGSASQCRSHTAGSAHLKRVVRHRVRLFRISCTHTHALSLFHTHTLTQNACEQRVCVVSGCGHTKS